MTNPLTTAERTGIRNWANLQFAIAHRYKDADPVRSEFYHGRSVAAGKIAGQYNPSRSGGPYTVHTHNWIFKHTKQYVGHSFMNNLKITFSYAKNLICLTGDEAIMLDRNGQLVARFYYDSSKRKAIGWRITGSPREFDIERFGLQSRNPKGAKTGPRPRCERCKVAMIKEDYWRCPHCGTVYNPKGGSQMRRRLPTGYPKCHKCGKGILRHSDRISPTATTVYHKKCLPTKYKNSNTLARNPDLYKSFHGVDPVRQKPVYYQPPPKQLISIGELSQINYKPVRGKYEGTEFYHKSGDLGERTLKTNLILATDPEGKNLYLVKRNKNSKYPVFSNRGILG